MYKIVMQTEINLRILSALGISQYYNFTIVKQYLHLQKQLPDMFCVKRVFLEFHKIDRKKPVPESLF